MDEEDYYADAYYPEEEDEDRFESEVKAFERAGPSGLLSEIVGNKEESAEDRFRIKVDAISRQFNADGIVTITQQDINNMIEKTINRLYISYRNPEAYILGYLASKGGTEMKKNVVLDVLNRILPKLKGAGGVMPPDVIRYARYWVLH